MLEILVYSAQAALLFDCLDVRRVERREVATEATQDVMRSIDFFVDTAGRKKASALWAEA